MKLLPEPPHTSSQDPLYNIGVVTRMTGISMATLRAWERRYDFPEAERTVGGHRLYSEHDIMRLRWVKERIDEGMQTAQAIQALRHQESHPLHQPEPPGRAVVDLASLQAGQALTAILEDLANALLSGDLQTAERIIGDALAAFPPETLITQVLGPAMRLIGDAWEAGQISVATEHLGTNYLRQRLLFWMVSGPPPLPIAPVLLACAPNEWHEGSLLALGALLRRQRCPVAYLGQAVPLPDLASFATALHPSLVVLVAMTEETALNLLEWPNYLNETNSKNLQVCFGGRAFVENPGLIEKIPGTYLGDSLDEGLKKIEALLAA